MAATIDIVFRKDKISKKLANQSSQVGPIYIRIIKNRKVKYISTGHKIDVKYWDENKRKVKPSYPNSARLNNYLNAIKVRYLDEILKQESTNTNFSSRELKRKITGDTENNFFEVARTVIDQYKVEEKIRSYNKGKSILEKIKRFNKGEKLLLEDLDVFFLSKYENYLKTVLRNKPNTINKDLRFIRRIFNEAIRFERIGLEKNPFNRYRLSTVKTNKTYLTDHELQAIESLELSKGSKVELHRDMFVFSAYVGGLRVSDILMLKWTQYDGVHLHLSIRKTKSQLSIKLPNKAIAIIERYSNKNRDFIFPNFKNEVHEENVAIIHQKISSATALINKNLKSIAAKAGIEKKLSFHVARHTWATRALRKGISIDKVSKLMGHAALKETQIYAKIVNEELDKAMDVFNN